MPLFKDRRDAGRQLAEELSSCAGQVILVDDGLATGASMRAAVAGVRAKQPDRIVVAVPTAAPETCEFFESEVDEVVCARTPEPFFGVGRWYQDFSQTSDEEVRMLLEQMAQELKY